MPQDKTNLEIVTELAEEIAVESKRKLQVQVGHPLVEGGPKISHDFG